MSPLALAILYQIGSLCGLVTMIFSLWRIQVRLVEANGVAVLVWALIGLIGLVGMVNHFRCAKAYLREWRQYRQRAGGDSSLRTS